MGMLAHLIILVPVYGLLFPVPFPSAVVSTLLSSATSLFHLLFSFVLFDATFAGGVITMSMMFSKQRSSCFIFVLNSTGVLGDTEVAMQWIRIWDFRRVIDPPHVPNQFLYTHAY